MYRNIEKSGFHPRDYVGCGDGTVWRIVRDASGRGFRATRRDLSADRSAVMCLYGTLRAISTALESQPC